VAGGQCGVDGRVDIVGAGNRDASERQSVFMGSDNVGGRAERTAFTGNDIGQLADFGPDGLDLLEQPSRFW
jgi:hypothetical protein